MNYTRRTTALCFLVVLMAGGLFVARAAAEPPIVLDTPLHTVRFQKYTFVHNVEVSPDGAHIYILTSRYDFNIWSVIVSYWPEVLGTLLGLLLVLTAWRFIRVRARLRKKGQKYCRKCNYCVSGLSTTTCPECGRDLARRRAVITARTNRRLPYVVIACTTIIAVAYALLWAFKAPRYSPFNQVLSIRSARLNDWAFANDSMWVNSHMAFSGRLIRVESSTGTQSILRTSRQAGGAFALSPLGNRIAIHDPFRCISVIDAAKGTEVHRFDSVSSHSRDYWGSVGPFSSDGRFVFALLLCNSERSEAMYLFDIETGDRIKLGSRKTVPSNQWAVRGSTFIPLPGHSLQYWARFPSMDEHMVTRDQNSLEMKVEAGWFDGEKWVPVQEWPVLFDIRPEKSFAIRDDHLVYSHSPRDRISDATIENLPAPPVLEPDDPRQGRDVANPTRALLKTGFAGSYWLYRTSDLHQLAMLNCADNVRVSDVECSTDHRVIAAKCQPIDRTRAVSPAKRFQDSGDYVCIYTVPEPQAPDAESRSP